jgi:hypothetical protein
MPQIFHSIRMEDFRHVLGCWRFGQVGLPGDEGVRKSQRVSLGEHFSYWINVQLHCIL